MEKGIGLRNNHYFVKAKSQNTYYRELSATAHNVADVRKASDDAKNHRALTGQKPIIFLDEIHRFTKSQQDFFLPPVERGDFTLIAATTENPSFRVNNALLSRCRVFVLGKLGEEDMIKVLRRAISFKVGGVEVTVPDKLLAHLAALCDGDARAAINVLEMALDATMNGNPEGSDVTLAEGAIMQALQKSSLLYDRNGRRFAELRIIMIYGNGFDREGCQVKSIITLFLLCTR